MTLGRSYLDAQLDCLRQSLFALAELSRDSHMGLQLAARLQDVASKLAGPASPQVSLARPIQLLDLTSHAKNTLGLLAAAGYLAEGAAPQLAATLDEVEDVAGKELRREVSARVYGLYVIIDPEVTGGRDPLEVARGALKGGARVVQLRDKLREKGHILKLARALGETCGQYNALLIINDHPDLAAVAGADGVHVGQGDMPVGEVRRVLGPGQIIGRSNHLVEEAVESAAHGTDHVALGNIYPTSTKASIRARAPTGAEEIRKLKGAVKVPVVAIGGINEGNIGPVVEAGADAICVVSAVGLAPDPEDASRRLVEAIHTTGGKA